MSSMGGYELDEEDQGWPYHAHAIFSELRHEQAQVAQMERQRAFGGENRVSRARTSGERGRAAARETRRLQREAM